MLKTTFLVQPKFRGCRDVKNLDVVMQTAIAKLFLKPCNTFQPHDSNMLVVTSIKYHHNYPNKSQIDIRTILKCKSNEIVIKQHQILGQSLVGWDNTRTTSMIDRHVRLELDILELEYLVYYYKVWNLRPFRMSYSFCPCLK